MSYHKNLAIRPVKNFIRREFRKSTPDNRIPRKCMLEFPLMGLTLCEWEKVVTELLDSMRLELRVKSDYEHNIQEEVIRLSGDEKDVIRKLVRKGVNLFITGKAGTGKTTRLRELVCDLSRSGKVAVVAPTGIAAKNAGGVTIHSLLQLPVGPWLPNNEKVLLPTIGDMTRQILQNLITLIIDEVSMVRCDLLDEVDAVLRFARNSELPFGGIQIIMFGDLYQLMPVMDDDDEEILSDVYDSPFFFSSKAFQRIKKTIVELDKVYRQDEPDFIEILNAVRTGNTNMSHLIKLNERYTESDRIAANAIRLTTHNYRAKQYNLAELDKINSKEYTYKASIRKEFGYIDLPKKDWPTDYYLRLKIGARVMFIRNDNRDYKYVNGTLGTVTDLWYDGVQVKTDEGLTVNVFDEKWEFYTYKYDKKHKVVIRSLYATFTQIPLRHAWSVTIHKSQGLTFDNVVIDAAKSFAAGQVYVALSRCRTLRGIQLVDKLSMDNIIVDPIVKKFMTDNGLKVN